MAEQEPDNAHYEQSGFSVVFMGFFALAMYAGVSMMNVELGFIGAPGILGIAVVFLTVGSYMVWFGRRREPTRQPVRSSEGRRG